MKKIICCAIIAAMFFSLVPAHAAGGSCGLKAVKIGDFGIPDFDPDVTEYTAYVPYIYHENDFDSIAVPNVTAWCEDENATVSVRYPETADGTIAVTVQNGGASKNYSFKLEPVGKNYYLNGNMEEDRYWTFHGQGATGVEFVSDAAVGNGAFRVDISGAYKSAALKQNNGAKGNGGITGQEACTALKPTQNGYDYLFTALTKGDSACSISPAVFNLRENERIKHYYIGNDNIAENNGSGSKRGGTSDRYSASEDKYRRTMSIYREAEDEIRYLDMSYLADRAIGLYVDEIYASELTVASLKYTGDTAAEFDSSGVKTLNLNAKIENAFGNSAGMEYASFEYRLADDCDGVSVNGDKLVISESAAAQNVLLEVICHPGFKSVQCPNENSVITTVAEINLSDTTNDGIFTYSRGAKNVTAELNPCYFRGVTSQLMFSTAVYETLPSGQKRLCDLKTKSVEAQNRKLVSYTETVEALPGNEVRSFVWFKKSMLPAAENLHFKSETEVYVSPGGSDENEGTIENPVATIAEAQKRIRNKKKSGKANPFGYTVYLRGGTYYSDAGLKLTKDDSGTASSPVVYSAYGNESAVMSGEKTIPYSALKKVTDTAVLDRLADQSVRDKLYSVDLKEFGVTDLGIQKWLGSTSYYSEYVSAGLVERKTINSPEVFIGGSPMTLARYPNSGTMTVGAVIDGGYNADNPGNKPLGAPFTIKVNDERIKKWTNIPSGKALMWGQWQFAWAEQTVPLARVDASAMTVTSTLGSVYSVLAGQPFYIYNLLEEIDAPGEYYIDYDEKLLYIYPPENYSGQPVSIVLMSDALVKMTNASYIQFRGIDFTMSRFSAVRISGGHDNLITDSEISYTCGHAVDITGTNNGITNSYIHDIDSGIALYGGDTKTLKAGQCYAENNEITRFGRIEAAYSTGITFGGVGNTARHNEIHNAPHMAVGLGGLNNIFEYNEIYDVLHEGDDAGAIYGQGSVLIRGNKIRYNYIHDLSYKGSSSKLEIHGVYLDNGIQENTVEGNIFENIAGTAVFVNGGPYNTANNNITVNCSYAYSLRNFDMSEDYTAEIESNSYVKTSQVWIDAFPGLQEYIRLSMEQKANPWHNVFSNNLCCKTEYYKASGYITALNVDTTGNIKTDGDPGFVNMSGRNYTLKDSSYVFSQNPSFKEVPFSRMGRNR